MNSIIHSSHDFSVASGALPKQWGLVEMSNPNVLATVLKPRVMVQLSSESTSPPEKHAGVKLKLRGKVNCRGSISLKTPAASCPCPMIRFSLIWAR